jgi:hypothetical protein
MPYAGEANLPEPTVGSPADRHRRASLLRYSPALVLIIVAIADIQRWADPDLWGHVAFGRAMLATHHLALHDPYSYSAPGHLWLNHEWLSEALMGAFYDLGGVIGLKLMKFGCCVALVAFLAQGLSEIDSPMTLQFEILVAASIAIAPQMQFRPQLFSFAMIAGLLAILTRYTYRGAAPLFALVPMFWLWANLHGEFGIGIAALATFTVVRTITDVRGGRGLSVGVRLLAILAASILVTLATPYGFDTWRAVWHALTNPHTRQVIDDWQPLTSSLIATWRENHAAAIPGLVAIAIFLALGVALVLNPRRGDSALVAVAVLMIVGALIAMRNLPLAVIATVMALAQHSSPFFRATPTPRASRTGQILIAAIAAMLLIGSGLLSPTLRAGSSKPVGAIAFMREHRLSGNVMSDFSWGEYVIWHLAPASKVFMDGRYDTVYPPRVIDDYLTFQYGGSGAKEVLRKYPHDFILLSPHDEMPLALIAAASEWKRIYRDGTCILFARADSEAAKISAVEVTAQSTPASYFP